jgi:hypothetical protein
LLGRLKAGAYIPPREGVWYRSRLALPYELAAFTPARRHALLYQSTMPDGRRPAAAIDAGDEASVLHWLRWKREDAEDVANDARKAELAIASIARMRSRAWQLPADYHFDRDDANSR